MKARSVASVATVAVACLLAGITPASPRSSPRDRVTDAVCALPTDMLVRTVNGHRADRSGDIELVPTEPDFVGQGGLPHSGPWDYVAEVPLLWYGPGYIRAQGRVPGTVTLADIAPTQASLLRYPFDAPDGSVLEEALVPRSQRPTTPPKLLVVVIWDGAGRVVLDEWPTAWPELAGLIDQGTWYDAAEVGSSPPSTAQIHATIGTGAFPAHHGLVGHQLRIGDRIAQPWDAGPRYLMLPTLADLYDRARGNDPVVGSLATVAIQLGMMGHGSLWGGGDEDIAVLNEEEGAATLGALGTTWNLTSAVEPYYRIPGYLDDLPPITAYLDDADLSDGQDDGRWHEVPLEDGTLEAVIRSPARVPWQTRLIAEVVRREGFGADGVPDLLFINYKLIDEVGHEYSLNSPQMHDAIVAQDRDLPDLISTLNEEVGEGRWVMALTADHGHTPDPAVSGASVFSPTAITELIQARFDPDGDDVRVAEFTQPTSVFIDVDELREHDATLLDVADYLLTVTKGEVGSPDFEPVPGVADDPAFAAVYPSEMLSDLPCVSEGRRAET